jgi:CRP-like cAMP-binding protein
VDVSIEALRSVYLLSTLDDEQLAAVRDTLRIDDLAAGEPLFDFGQPASRFYYLRSGQIKLTRSSPAGGEKVIEIVHPGETFGEVVMFLEKKNTYPVSAQAVDDSVTWGFLGQTILDILRASPDACFAMMANMSWRLRQHVDEIQRLTLHSATERAVAYLLSQIPPDVVESPEIHLTTPKHVIASRLAIKPETFSRILGRLVRAGLVDVHGQDIVLRDVAGLRALPDQED